MSCDASDEMGRDGTRYDQKSDEMGRDVTKCDKKKRRHLTVSYITYISFLIYILI